MNSIGDVIRKRRKELNLSIEDLSEGICSKSSLARIEINEQIPRRATFEALMQRLGIPCSWYPSIMEQEEEDIYQLRYEIFHQALKHEYSEVERLLKILESKKQLENVYLQLILYIKGVLYQSQNEFSDALKQYYQSLSLSIKNFKLNKILHYRLTQNEINIINCIASAYYQSGRHNDAAMLYNQLLEYHEHRFLNMDGNEGTYIMVLYNLSLVLIAQKKYNHSVEICDKGIKICIQYDEMGAFPYLLYTKAINLNRLNKNKEAFVFLKKAYLFFEFNDDLEKCCMIERFIHVLQNDLT